MISSNRTFRSKVDLSLAIIASLGFGGGFVGAGVLFLERTTAMTVIGFLTVLLLCGVLFCVFPMRYHLEDAELRIQSGWMVFRVPFEAITAVSPSHPDLVAAPAWSRDRIIISYGPPANRRTVHIAPEPRDEFLEALADAAHLERSGARLTRLHEQPGWPE